MKVSLQQVRMMVREGVFIDVPQPDFCYHYSTKDNIKEILRDGKIKQFDDYMTFFFYRLEDIPVYLDLSGAYHGRKSHTTKGTIITYPPVIPEDCAVLKLYPSRKEPLAWYEERAQRNAKNDTEKELLTVFDSIRICHYGNLSFKPDPEIIELKEVIEKYPYTRPERLRSPQS